MLDAHCKNREQEHAKTNQIICRYFGEAELTAHRRSDPYPNAETYSAVSPCLCPDLAKMLVPGILVQVDAGAVTSHVHHGPRLNVQFLAGNSAVTAMTPRGSWRAIFFDARCLPIALSHGTIPHIISRQDANQ